MLTKTIVLDDIFDPAKGWQFPAHQVPLSRGAADDGNPYYYVTVDGIDLLVFEQTAWKDNVKSNVAPTRLVVKSYITGVTITEPGALLMGTNDSNGLPSLGLDEEENVTVQVSLPIAEDFPLEWLRKQLMVCMGLVTEETQDLIRAWNTPDNALEEANFNWDTAKNVASVAGSFVAAFFKE